MTHAVRLIKIKPYQSRIKNVVTVGQIDGLFVIFKDNNSHLTISPSTENKIKFLIFCSVFSIQYLRRKHYLITLHLFRTPICIFAKISLCGDGDPICSQQSLQDPLGARIYWRNQHGR